jgi:LysM repeat protein
MVKGKKLFWMLLAGVICFAQLNAQESKNPFTDKKIEIQKVFDSIRDSNNSEIKVVQEPENPQEVSSAREEEENNEITVRVRSGDTLSKIAQQYLGSAEGWRQIEGLTNVFRISVGSLVCFPVVFNR